jgi:hypothetical protein
MPLWRNQKPIVKLHHLVLHALRQLRATALLKKKRSAETKFHPREMETDAHSRAATEGHICGFLLGGHGRLVQEAETVKAEGWVSSDLDTV